MDTLPSMLPFFYLKCKYRHNLFNNNHLKAINICVEIFYLPFH